MRRRILICAGASLCALIASALTSWPSSQPNVLVITLDTTRADRLGCYGYEAARTPALDSLAAAGVLCEQAYTVAPLTLPAHTSLFTGLYPAETGIRRNGDGRLHNSIPILAQELAHNGYDTGAFVAAVVLDRIYGLDRGFRTYDDEFASAETGTLFGRRRSGDKVVDAALAWLKKKRSGPFCCWVHLFDAHLPYVPHDDALGGESLTSAYDGEIAYADRQVGRLLEFLREQGLDRQTLVVVAGDHGEGLGEHGEKTHSWTLYNSTLRVPLIWRWSGHLQAGRRMPSSVSLVDVYPTILDELGLQPSKPISGRSLRTALSGADAGISTCYASTDEPFLQNRWSPVRTLITGNWKFIHTTRPELYDLANDPHEQHDLAEINPVQKQDLERSLADFKSRLVPRHEIKVQLSPAEAGALASLGYSAGPLRGPAVPGGEVLPDVKDMLKLNAAVDEICELASRVPVETTIRRLHEIVRQSPTHTRATLALADAFVQNSQLDEAAEAFLNLLEVNPNARAAHFGLANVFAVQKRYDEAVAEFQKELDINPLWIEPHYGLARLAVMNEDLDGALRHFAAMLEIDGACAVAYRERGDLFAGMGRIAEAIADYRKALQFNPADAATAQHLRILLSDRHTAERPSSNSVLGLPVQKRGAARAQWAD